MTQHRRPSWSGGNGRGGPSFNAQEAQRVKRILIDRHVGRLNATSTARLTDAAGFKDNGRTVRAILSALDGVEFILAMPSDGNLYICEFEEEVERTTRQLRSRARKMNERADRRDALQGSYPLPRRQLSFGFDEDDEEEIDL